MEVLINLAFILLFSGLAAVGSAWIMNELSLRSTWICKRLDWHHPPLFVDLEGKDFVGECPRCKHKIRQTTTGSWVRLNNE